MRVHPAKPKVGLRTEKPNEMWHIDTTIIRLVDGTKAYLHAVIDNYSRRILSWRVGAKFDTGNTVAVPLEACQRCETETPTVLADGGVENVNRNVDELIESGLLRRVLAMTELRFSNSMIEAWWRALKHQWLFLNTLDSVETIERLVRFYVKEHNERLPHSAFKGQTPDEMYFEGGDDVPDGLDSARKAARKKRLAVNRALACAVCEATPDSDAAKASRPQQQDELEQAVGTGRSDCVSSTRARLARNRRSGRRAGRVEKSSPKVPNVAVDSTVPLAEVEIPARATQVVEVP